MIDNRGSVRIRYAELYNLVKQNYDVTGYRNDLFDLIDHSLITRMGLDRPVAVKRRDDGYFSAQSSPTFSVDVISNSRIYRIGREDPYAREVDNVTSGASGAYLTNGAGNAYWTDAITWLTMRSSVLDNSYLSSPSPDYRYLPDLIDSVILNGNQSWVNQYGELVTKGSNAQLAASSSIKSKPLLVTASQIDGQTYALIYIQNPAQPTTLRGSEDKVLSFHEFAASLGGSLAVYSSDEEREGIRVWLDGYWNRLTNETSDQLLDLCGNSPDLCSYMKGDRWKANQFAYGVYRGESGWGWITGEEPELTGYDPTKDANIIENSEYRFVLGYVLLPKLQFRSPPNGVTRIAVIAD